ncbi:60S ribosomal protein L18a-like protein [Linum perenne]
MDQGRANDLLVHTRDEYLPIGDACELDIFDNPLPCCGCGIGWFSFLLGFVCPVLWYVSTILYFGSYYHKDPRERSGLAACAIAALVCTIAVAISLLVIFL